MTPGVASRGARSLRDAYWYYHPFWNQEPVMPVYVTSKGQVTIPERVRELLEIRPGSAVEFHVDPDGRVTVRGVGRPHKVRSRFAELRGTATVRMRTEEIMALTRAPIET